jgi:MoaA/NifB/PqqE/SkfB family radical SAM enzyme
MKFDIEADWTLSLICNYACKYCFFHSQAEERSIRRISPEECLEFFNSTGKTWLLHLTGGEPFLYPDFVRMCQKLTSQHFISLNSNLTSQRVLDFAAEIDPSRVKFVHCGVHVEERDRRKGWHDLEAHVASLVERGFPVFASQVMTPPAFADFARVADLFAKLGVALIPKAIRGSYEGRWYPQAYNKSQRILFSRFSEQAELIAKTSTWQPDRQLSTINPLLDCHYLDGFPDFTDIQCFAGKSFVSIYYDGTIYRCGHRTPLGNIFSKGLDLFSEDRPCDDEYCPYWCLRFSRFDKETTANYPRQGGSNKLKEKLVAMRAVLRELWNGQVAHP